MDVGMSHKVKFSGEVIPARWVTLNPNAIFGRKTELHLVTDIPVDISTVLDDVLLTEDYIGRFERVDRIGVIDQFRNIISIPITTDDTIIEFRGIVLSTDGVVWAYADLADYQTIRPNLTTTLEFESLIHINNIENISQAPWSTRVGEFDINFGLRFDIIPLPIFDNLKPGYVYTINHDGNTETTDKELLVDVLKNGRVITPDVSFKDGLFTLTIAPKDGDVMAMNIIFVRLLWNLGFLLYIRDVRHDTDKWDGLILHHQHEISFSVNFNFREINNGTHI